MKAIIYGAGSIGRGFISELMFKSFFDIVLIDVDTNLITLLNEKKMYPLTLISQKKEETINIPIKKIINGNDSVSIINEIRNCDIIFTAVGTNALKYIAKNLAMGLNLRKDSVNIILCENMVDANIKMGNLLLQYMDSLDKVGLLRASVGRMVPVSLTKNNLLSVKAEPYYNLPVDGDGIVGILPEFIGLIKVSPFDYAIDKKLYIHNLGHVACAWLGQKYNYEYIYECLEVKEIKDTVYRAMHEAALGLIAKYNCSKEELDEHIDDLIYRFSNNKLKDTVKRVGKDTKRKLSSTDRVVGALNLCIKYNIENEAIVEIIKAGLLFKNDDEGTNYVQTMIISKGVASVITDICGINQNSKVFKKLSGF